jgi:hypothetical protein
MVCRREKKNWRKNIVEEGRRKALSSFPGTHDGGCGFSHGVIVFFFLRKK